MKIYLLEIDDTLTIFAVVSKKRTGFDGKNVVGVGTYDLETGNQVAYQTIPELGIVNIKVARDFWSWWIEYALSGNHKIKRTESVYNSKNGNPILMDGHILKAMEEISIRKLDELRN